MRPVEGLNRWGDRKLDGKGHPCHLIEIERTGPGSGRWPVSDADQFSCIASDSAFRTLCRLLGRGLPALKIPHFNTTFDGSRRGDGIGAVHAARLAA